MDIKVLYTLISIAEHGSFLAASRSLGLSPAAVSLHVKVIEEELKITLFDRSVRPPTLTEPGRRTLARARRVVEAWEQLGETSQPDRGGMLAIGAVTTAIGTLVVPALDHLRTQRPQLRFNVITAPSEELEERVGRGLLDAALVVQPSSSAFDLRFDPVLSETLQIVAPATASSVDEATLLQSLPYVRFRRHTWINNLVDLELGRRRLRVDTSMDMDTFSGALAVVAAGLGVSIMPGRQLAASARAALRTVPFGDPPVAFTLGLLRRSEHPKGPQLDEFMAVLASVGEQPSALERGEQQAETDDEHQIDAQG